MARRSRSAQGTLARRAAWRWFAALAAIAAVAAAACGGGDAGPDAEGTTPPERALNPIPANSELVVGPNKFGMGLIDANNEPILGDAGTAVRLRFLFEDELREETDARFLWAIPDVSGFWRADVNFDEAGRWKANVVLTRDGKPSTANIEFTVAEAGAAPMIGDPAPATNNLTLTDVPDLKRLSTDPEPEPALYQMTVTEALQTGRPLVVVFATPAFCETRFCGPVLDNVKEVWREFGDRVNFIHIEPFELDDDGQLATVSRPGGGADRVPGRSMLDWNLQSEPWVFVMDEQGRVATRFEGTAVPDEIREALRAVLSD